MSYKAKNRFTSKQYAARHGCTYSTAKRRLTLMLKAGTVLRFETRTPYEYYDRQRRMLIKGSNASYLWEYVCKSSGLPSASSLGSSLQQSSSS